MVPKVKYIWMDGKMVDWDNAKIHVLTHTFHYGYGAFEGIRAYETRDGRSAVFRLEEHVERLFDSCRILQIDVPFTPEQIVKACTETLAVNGLPAAYIRPVVYVGEGGLGLYPGDNPVHVMIAVWEWGAYLGETAIKEGIRAKVSSFQRFHPNSIMTRAKINGHYVTGVLAKKEAKTLGYDEGILLDPDGYVAEGSGENIFIVRKGRIKTTPLTVILPGITRDSVMTIADDLGYSVREERFTRDELYLADEAFFCGTAAEVTPIREVDDRPIGSGKPGPVTQKIQERYFAAVQGGESARPEWLAHYEPKA